MFPAHGIAVRIQGLFPKASMQFGMNKGLPFDMYDSTIIASQLSKSKLTFSIDV